MTEDLSQESIDPPRPKGLKWQFTICTVIYIFLFPFLFYLALLSSMASDGPSITPFMVGLIMLTMFCLPLSIPVSIYLMWSRYYGDQYDKALFFSWLPLYVFTAIMILFGLVPYVYYSIHNIFAYHLTSRVSFIGTLC